jgi:hypothetical protein
MQIYGRLCLFVQPLQKAIFYLSVIMWSTEDLLGLERRTFYLTGEKLMRRRAVKWDQQL